MKLYVAKVNGEFLRAARQDDNWTWEEAQKELKQIYGENAVIEFVPSKPEVGVEVEVMPEDTNWLDLSYEQ